MTGEQMRAVNLTRGTAIADRLDVAATMWARFRGLMGRSRASFAPGDALWFEGTSSIHMMFMRFPIDCVFLSADDGGIRRVVGLRRGLRRWIGVVWYVRGAAGLIELPAGAIEQSGTAMGDEVRLEGWT